MSISKFILILVIRVNFLNHKYFVNYPISPDQMADLMAWPVPELFENVGRIAWHNPGYFEQADASLAHGVMTFNRRQANPSIRILNEYGVFYSPNGLEKDESFTHDIQVYSFNGKWYMHGGVTAPFHFHEFHSTAMNIYGEPIQFLEWQTRMTQFHECIVNNNDGNIRVMPTSDIPAHYLVSGIIGHDKETDERNDTHLVDAATLIELGQFGSDWTKGLKPNQPSDQANLN